MVQIIMPEASSADFVSDLQQTTGISNVQDLNISATELHEVIVHAVDSVALWGCIATGAQSYFNRNQHCKVVIEKDGQRIEISGLSREEIQSLLAGGKLISITEQEDNE